MSDPVTPPAGEKPGVPPAAPATPAPTGDVQPVTPEQVAALTSTIAELQKQVKFVVSKITKSPTAVVAPDENEQLTVVALKRQMDEDKRAGVEKDRRANEKIARNAYKELLVANGLNPVHAQDIAAAYAAKHRDGIKVLDDDSVHVVEMEGLEAKPMAVVAAEWLKTDHGKSYVQAKKMPTTEVGKSGPSGGSGEHPFSKLTAKQIMDHPDFSLRHSYQKNHADEWADKSKTLFAK